MATVLRPMTTGEILDRTFTIYRSNFWLFVGIAALPPGLMLAANLLFTATTAANLGTAGKGAAGMAAAVGMIIAGIGMIVAAIAYLVGLAVAQGASVYAVSAVHLGRTTSVRESYRKMKGKYGRVVWAFFLIFIRFAGIALVFVVPIIVPSLILGGRGRPEIFAIIGIAFLIAFIPAIVLVLIMIARYSLVVPACVLEDLKARAAIKRSVFLAKGSKGKILAIYILIAVLNLAISFVLVTPFQFLAIFTKGEFAKIIFMLLHNLAQFIAGALIGPLAIIAFALVYYDERVRKEAYDIQLLMESVAGPPPAPPTPPEISGTPATAL